MHAFEKAGRDLSKLSIKPGPIPRFSVVDTSSNPGRTVGRVGFREGLGHVMWLSWKFFEVAQVERERVLEVALGYRIESYGMRLCLSALPFSDVNPPSEALRLALFGNRGPASPRGG